MSQKHRLIAALQSTGAAGYYAVAHCTAQTDRQRHQMQQQQQQQQQQLQRMQVHRSRLNRGGSNNIDDSEFYDDDEYDDDDDDYVNTASFMESLETAKINHVGSSAVAERSYGSGGGGGGGGGEQADSPSLRPESVVTSSSAGDLRTMMTTSLTSMPKASSLKPFSTPPPVKRGIRRRDDSGGSNEDSSATSARHADARDASHSSNPAANGGRYHSDGGLTSGRQRVSFNVANDSTPSSSKIQSNASFDRQQQQQHPHHSTPGPHSSSGPPTDPVSASSSDRLHTGGDAGAAAAHLRHAHPANGGVAGDAAGRTPAVNAIVVHAAIEARPMSPSRKLLHSKRDGVDGLVAAAGSSLPNASGGQFSSPSSSATVPRRTNAAGGNRYLRRPVNGAGRSFDALLPAGGVPDSGRQFRAGSDMSLMMKPASSSPYNHARLVGDELVIFNGVD
jgi:hypothetical protein